MTTFTNILKGEPTEEYGIPLEAYIKYQLDHIDRVESTTEDHMDTVTITRTSPISGNMNEMTFNISQHEYDTAYAAWQAGMYIQDAFPTLDADQREFIKTGITPDEWNSLFGSEE